jgi:hypothetical protein
MQEHQTAPLDENLSSNPDNSILVTTQLKAHWQELPLWAKILAVTNFISGGAQLLSMFWLIPMLRRMYGYTTVQSNNFLVMLIILYLVSITFTLLIGWQLWRYTAHLQNALQHSDQEELEISYYYQYRYFKTLGWMVISLAIIIIMAIVTVFYNANRY